MTTGIEDHVLGRYNTVADPPYQDVISQIYAGHPFMPGLRQVVPDVTFQITDACNLACSYCYQINKGHHVMPIEVAKKFIDLLLDNDIRTQRYMDTYTHGVVIGFIGGEPLLEVDLMDQIIEYFEEQCILKNHPWQYHHRFDFSTNGTLYFEPKVQEFIKKHEHHLTFGVSIDGTKELHDACRKFPDGRGSYDLAMAAVQDYHKRWPENVIQSKMTLAPGNIQYLSEAVIDLLDKQNYTAINLNCVYEEGWTYEHATTMYYQLKEIANYFIANNWYEQKSISLFESSFFRPKDISDTQNWCGGNGRMIAVDYKGDIYPCIRYMESSLGDTVPPVIIGNVYDGLLPNAKCEACARELQAVNRITQSTDECINCSIAEGCAWCQAYNYQVFGDFKHRTTFHCIMHQATALANAYYWNMLALDLGIRQRMKLWLEDEKALKIIPEEELALLRALEKIE